MSMSAVMARTPLPSSVSSIVPVKALKPPSWLPVTFEPTKPIFEVSGESTSEFPVAAGAAEAVDVGSGTAAAGVGSGAGAADVDSCTGAPTVACGTSSAGFAHPETTAARSTALIIIMRLIMSPPRERKRVVTEP